MVYRFVLDVMHDAMIELIMQKIDYPSYKMILRESTWVCNRSTSVTYCTLHKHH